MVPSTAIVPRTSGQLSTALENKGVSLGDLHRVYARLDKPLLYENKQGWSANVQRWTNWCPVQMLHVPLDVGLKATHCNHTFVSCRRHKFTQGPQRVENERGVGGNGQWIGCFLTDQYADRCIKQVV